MHDYNKIYKHYIHILTDGIILFICFFLNQIVCNQNIVDIVQWLHIKFCLFVLIVEDLLHDCSIICCFLYWWMFTPFFILLSYKSYCYHLKIMLKCFKLSAISCPLHIPGIFLIGNVFCYPLRLFLPPCTLSHTPSDSVGEHV